MLYFYEIKKYVATVRMLMLKRETNKQFFIIPTFKTLLTYKCIE